MWAGGTAGTLWQRMVLRWRARHTPGATWPTQRSCTAREAAPDSLTPGTASHGTQLRTSARTTTRQASYHHCPPLDCSAVAAAPTQSRYAPLPPHQTRPHHLAAESRERDCARRRRQHRHRRRHQPRVCHGALSWVTRRHCSRGRSWCPGNATWSHLPRCGARVTPRHSWQTRRRVYQPGCDASVSIPRHHVSLAPAKSSA